MGDVVTVSVPLKLTRRGSRKVVIAPDGTRAAAAPQQPVVSTLVKALARAHRWKDMLESGAYASVTDLARAEKINDSYVCRMLRLTLLAPEIIEAILGGTQPPTLSLAISMRWLPVSWAEQQNIFSGRIVRT
jgi:hypothetical protein